MSMLRGKISSVTLNDFVTYDYVKFQPGPQLNVIIGPNGTGKSTLIAAIVLGMGGRPELLSRALNIGDYVKNGKQTAVISIDIHRSDTDAGDLATFQRDIDADGQTRYRMDGRTSTKSAFLRAVDDLNIQVGNLCQFLPQDRVQDFAKQNAQELLASTQSSVCAPAVEQAWLALKEMRERQRSAGTSRADNVAQLDDFERRNAALESQIQTMHRRNGLLADHEMCTKKMAWMEFEELYVKHQELTADKERADANLQKHTDEMRPLREQIAAIDARKASFERSIGAHEADADRRAGELEAHRQSVDAQRIGMRKVRDDYEFVCGTNDERAGELERANRVQELLIADVRAHQAAAGTEADRTAALRTLDERIAAEREAVRRLLSQRHDIGEQLHDSVKPQLLNAENRLRAAESIGDRKLELLRTRFEHVHRSVLWLRENRHLFSGRVYEPMVLELNVKDSRHAKYLEACVSTQDLVAFVCEQMEDMELLHRKLRGELRLNVNLIHSPAAEQLAYRAKCDIRELAQFGFYAYLIDMVDGPVPVLNALCKNNRVHTVPVGNDRTYDMADEVPPDVSLFYSSKHQFMVTRSKYTSGTSSSCSEIKNASLLNIGIDSDQLAALKEHHAKLVRESDKLRNQRIQIEDVLRQKEETMVTLQAERQAILARKTALNACNEKLRRQMQKIKTLPLPVDLHIEEQKMHAALQANWQRILQLQRDVVPLFDAYNAAKSAHNQQREHFAKFLHTNHHLHSELEARRDDADKAARIVERIRELLERSKRACREKQSAAKALTDGRTPGGDAEQFPFRAAFDRLPDVIDELRSHMDELQGEIDCLNAEGADAVVAEYEQRKRDIERLRVAIGEHEQQASALGDQMAELHERWHPIVSGTVATINENFARYMTAMSFAGEVQLTHGLDERDYAEYGIEIRVKYRNNERLQKLDRNVQSGGERAVAIAVYSLALQQISHVPFRCVDEINQGMDATNERKIFNMLVAETGRPQTSQYFFVTPKLLPNLDYNEEMTVHVVHNGRFVRNERMFERRWV